MLLSNRVAIITGGATVWAGAPRSIRRGGCDVVVADVKVQEAKKTLGLVKEKGERGRNRVRRERQREGAAGGRRDDCHIRQGRHTRQQRRWKRCERPGASDASGVDQRIGRAIRQDRCDKPQGDLPLLQRGRAPHEGEKIRQDHQHLVPGVDLSPRSGAPIITRQRQG